MSPLLRTSATLSLPFALLCTTALADLAPSDVWGDWRQYMEGMGYTVTATEATSGDSLTVSDIALSMTMPEDDMSMSLSFEQLNFTPNGDGSVNVLMPEVMPMVMNLTTKAEDQEPVTATMTVTQTGHSIVASGSPEKITYDYAADTVGMSLQQVQVGADTYGPENAKLDLLATGLSSSTTMTIGDMRGYEQAGKIASLQYDVLINNPEDAIVVKFKGGATDITSVAEGMIPTNLSNTNDMSAMLKAGFDVAGKFTYSGGSSDMAVTDPVNGNFSAVSSSTGGSLTLDIGPDGVGYGGTQTGLKATANVAALPFPIEIGMAEGGFNLTAPATKSDTAQDFGLGIKLSEFTMSDAIWGMFDPSNQLPRDPATIILDLTGKAKLFVDYLDPAVMAEAGPEAPGEVESVTINQLLVNAVGARLEGSGAVNFDNTDMTTMPGMPKPVGAIDLSLAGANGLLDKLVAMGLLPQDQAMGARMMMGMFGVPGSEPDTLTSKVEFTEEGQILANGQRIK